MFRSNYVLFNMAFAQKFCKLFRDFSFFVRLLQLSGTSVMFGPSRRLTLRHAGSLNMFAKFPEPALLEGAAGGSRLARLASLKKKEKQEGKKVQIRPALACADATVSHSACG